MLVIAQLFDAEKMKSLWFVRLVQRSCFLVRIDIYVQCRRTLRYMVSVPY